MSFKDNGPQITLTLSHTNIKTGSHSLITDDSMQQFTSLPIAAWLVLNSTHVTNLPTAALYILYVLETYRKAILSQDKVFAKEDNLSTHTKVDDKH